MSNYQKPTTCNGLQIEMFWLIEFNTFAWSLIVSSTESES